MPSTVVKNMQYDAVTQTLKIVFVSGMIYEYENVPLNVYQSMKASKSKGKYLNEHIKNKFEFIKLDS
jgi:hypothetical protein